MHTQLATPNTFVDSSSPQKNKSRGSKGSNNKSSPPRNRNYSKTTENNTMKTPTKASQRMVNHQSDYILNSDVNTSKQHQYNTNTHQQQSIPFPFSEKSLKMLQKDTDQIPTKEAVSNILELLTRKDNLVKLSEYASPQQHAPITIDSPLNVSSSYSYVNAPVTPTKPQSEKIVRPLSPPTRDSNRPRRNSANQNNNMITPSSMMSNNNTAVNHTINNNNGMINNDSTSPVSRWAGSISAPAPSQLPKPVFFSSPKSDHSAPSTTATAVSTIAEQQPQQPIIHKSSAARQLQFNSIPVNTTVPAPQMTPMPFPFPPVAAHYAPEQQHAMLHPTVQHMMAHVAASSTVANNNQDLGQLSNQLKMMLNIAPSSVRS